MSILSLNSVSVSFGAEDVLASITCVLNAGDRVGLVGRNGAGKTTLLQVLAGQQQAPGGRHLARGTRVSLVEQLPSFGSMGTVHSQAVSALEDILELEEAMHRSAADMAGGDVAAMAAYAELEHRFEAAGGFSYHGRMAEVLGGLGFPSSEWDRPLSQLSGGQRSRLGLACALLSRPDVLLMDEPTNHLDIAGLSWLEGFLSRWSGTIVVTSHDRQFLDKVANQIWYLTGQRMAAYPGNYTKFTELRTDETARQQQEYEAQQEFIQKEEAFIRRYRAGQRSQEAKGRQTRLNRLERLTAPGSERSLRSLNLRLKPARTGEVVISTRELSAGYDGETTVQAGNLEITRGAKVALIGANGSGKSTLLKTMAGHLSPVAGSTRLGTGVVPAFYWQEAENLDPSRTVFEQLLANTNFDRQELRDLLGAFLFSGDDVFKSVSVLSGGERSRLALAQLVSSGANLLLLDEPTNHLDIPSREALESALAGFAGTILLVSHDRRLIGRVASELWSIEDGKIRTYAGLDEYEHERRQQAAESARPKAAPRLRPQPRSKQAREIEQLEAEIVRLEGRLEELGAAINDASGAGDLEGLKTLGLEFDQVNASLAEVMEAWASK